MFVFGVNKKKKLFVLLLAFFVFSGVIFAFADVWVVSARSLFASCKADGGSGFCFSEDIGEAAESGFKWLLYGVFVFFGWLASIAVTIFGWAIDPNYISGNPGLFNRQSVYEMWKFIRDFFNLFFILVLLYIAFTVVFQIQKDFKKALLSLVLAALFINFSFPVTRALIDATNVPMYFFANQMLNDPNKPGESFGTALRASQLEAILIPGSRKGEKLDTDTITVSRLIAAIVFMFVFSITLLTLAVLFLIRLLALLILLVFSSVGFAASIVPGMEQYSKMWWESFWKYALFGPAAMFMLLVATRFFREIGDEQSAFIVGFKKVATGVTTPEEMGFVAAMAMYSIPIIILWMAMGLAQKMSIAGASSVVGFGQKASKWLTKKATYDNPVMRGIGGGLKEKTGINKVQKWWKAPSKIEAGLKGGIIGVGGEKGWKGGVAHELRSIKDKEIREKAAEHKKNNTGIPTLEQDLSSGNEVTRKAAALALAESKNLNSPEHLQKALAAVNDDMNMYAKVLESASRNALGMSGGQVQSSLKKVDATSSEADKAMAVNQLKAVSAKMKKEGKVKGIVEYEVNVHGDTNKAYADTIGKMGSEDIAKQEGIHSDPAFHQYVQNNMDPKKMQSVMTKVMEKAGNDVQEEWTKILSGVKIKVEGPKIAVEEGYRTRPRT